MKTLFKTVLVILGLIIYSCNDKKVQNKEITSSSYDTLESPPSKPEYLNDKKKYVLPNIANITVEDLNPVFLELLRDKKILRTENLDKNKSFINGSARNTYNLYYKGKFPVRAGEYKNEGDFMLYDFIYANDNQYIIAHDNLKNELKKLNNSNNHEYFDYFKGVGFVYFFDKEKSKISLVSFSRVSGNHEYEIIKKFVDKHKNEFDEIIFADATNIEIIN
ncbi:hypothetical protein SAMN05443633_102435 [Chryseobacterium arachidis]|uniref:Lipoprotein n=1 Tax=Chryseobacterium arachidis TaxID=1416778 RepID=A0A1M4XUZ3_9FLAO|nr:hypothetical protein [Chryseobacterium arachidis]SHE97397.1 hypothetical protein SAMN05443633_102435 [Chryseobacterium arachidis]